MTGKAFNAVVAANAAALAAICFTFAASNACCASLVIFSSGAKASFTLSYSRWAMSKVGLYASTACCAVF